VVVIAHAIHVPQLAANLCFCDTLEPNHVSVE
jgi:hypothetical protein